MSRQIEDFARALRELRRRAGSPSFRSMAAESGYSVETLTAAVSGVELPPLTVTLAYVTACGGNVDAWRDRWRELAGGEDTVETEPVRRQRRRTLTRLPLSRTARLVSLLAGALAIALAATLFVDRSDPPPIQVAAPSSATDHPADSQVPSQPGAQSLSSAPRSSPQGANAPAAQPEYRAVAGPGCPMNFTRQIDISSADGNDGWREARGGSWTGDSCDNRFLYSKIDPDAAQSESPENYFQWRYMFDGAATRRCLIEVYVPDSANASARLFYDVADRFENVETNIGQFVIDQFTSRGGWVNAATVTVGTANLMIKIGDDGEGWPPGRDAVAAGPVRLTCARSG
jgi:hypothetical protein